MPPASGSPLNLALTQMCLPLDTAALDKWLWQNPALLASQTWSHGDGGVLWSPAVRLFSAGAAGHLPTRPATDRWASQAVAMP
ncbi:hypothetical protein MHYP_G00020810 [Metynnis hypsauchen]